jgi:hypothetical protein
VRSKLHSRVPSGAVRLLFTDVARVQAFGRDGTDVLCHKFGHAVFVLYETDAAGTFA